MLKVPPDNADGVICCRVSPAQKAEVVRLVQENMPGKLTLSIGDGANDVAMIQQAHIGVGISGLEGLQAVNAADYAIAQFRFLERLTLVHGRYSYKRLTRLINFSFHKNIIFTVPQILFIIVSCWSGTLYQPTLSGLFNVLFAALPVLGLGIWEQDLTEKLVLQRPIVYRSGQTGQSFNYSRFFWSMTSATLQGVFVFLACFWLFQKDFVGSGGLVSGFVSVGLLAYTVVNIIVTLKVAMLLHSWTW